MFMGRENLKKWTRVKTMNLPVHGEHGLGLFRSHAEASASAS
jgi:hypothetical protein